MICDCIFHDTILHYCFIWWFAIQLKGPFLGRANHSLGLGRAGESLLGGTMLTGCFFELQLVLDFAYTDY
jgi:hypothetical protein